MAGKTFYVTTETRQQEYELLAMEGDDQAVNFDFSPWAGDNGAVSSVTWSVESGQAAVDGEALASSVASARITTSQTGKSLIKISATDGTHTKVVFLKVHCKEPYTSAIDTDYGFVQA